MLTTAHDLFPPIPAVSPSSEVRLSMGDLRSCIEGVAYAVSEDRTREILTGVLMKYEENTLTCVATDTHRLAVHRLSREGIGSEISVIVPKKALDAIKRMPLGADEEITLRFDSDRLGVDIGTSVIVSQLLEGNYPNWERVVPSEYTRQWTLDRQELIENLKRASILAKNNSQRVTLSCKGEKLTITAKSDDLGQATEEVDVVPSNGDLDIAFNVKYILDALSALNGEGVRSGMTESTRPAVLRPVETEASGSASSCRWRSTNRLQQNQCRPVTNLVARHHVKTHEICCVSSVRTLRLRCLRSTRTTALPIRRQRQASRRDGLRKVGRLQLRKEPRTQFNPRDAHHDGDLSRCRRQ